MTADSSVPSKQYLRKVEQAQWLGVHPRTIKRIAADDPTFPPEIPLTGGLLVRSRAELEAWLEARRGHRIGDPKQPLPDAEVVPIKRGRGRPRKE